MSYYVDCFKSYEAEIAGLKERNAQLVAALEEIQRQPLPHSVRELVFSALQQNRNET